MLRVVLFATLFCFATSLPCAAATLHVPSEYPLILDAMVFATYGDTVLVECGHYYEGNIPMKNGVTLMSETGQVGCAMIDPQHMSRAIDCTDCDENTAIIGFTITQAFATGVNEYGAGIKCLRSSPRLENLKFIFCQVRSATAYGGGGLGCLDSSPTLSNVEFDGCVLDEATSGGGGAMVAVGQSSPTLNNVTFDTNWTTTSPGGALAVLGYGGQVVRLNEVTFIDNSADVSGGGLYVGGSTTVLDGAVFQSNWAPEGGGIHLDTCRPCTLRNIVFEDNTAASGDGGGLLCQMYPDGIATLKDISFFNNTADGRGGGVALRNSTMPVMSYATFARNTAPYGGAIDLSESSLQLSNATFCMNEASAAGGGIYLDGDSFIDLDASIIAYSTDGEGIAQWGTAPQSIACTDIYGNTDGDWVGALALYEGVDGNFSEQPLFCELLNDNYTLHVDSPCLPYGNDCGILIGAHGLGCPTSDVPESGIASVQAATPNPFSGSTSISYELPAAGVVDARVFDASGRLVRTLADAELQQAGSRVLSWDGRDEGGRYVASGVYFFRVDLDGRSTTRRAVLLR